MIALSGIMESRWIIPAAAIIIVTVCLAIILAGFIRNHKRARRRSFKRFDTKKQSQESCSVRCLKKYRHDEIP
jgi:hypothetical protein